jgi:hypothetical protein
MRELYFFLIFLHNFIMWNICNYVYILSEKYETVGSALTHPECS